MLAATARGWTTTIAPGVDMPWVSLGTCCGSDPAVGVVPWLAASTSSFKQPVAGIDTAYDYNDQDVIAAKLTATPRESVFLTTKIPGAAFLNGDPKIVCPSRDFRACALRAVKTDLSQLKMDAADLILIHDPGLANGTAVSAALWQGMQDALKLGLTRSIGVSNFNGTQLDELVAQPTTSVVPAVNQISMGVGGARPEGTLAACRRHGVMPQVRAAPRAMTLLWPPCYGGSCAALLSRAGLLGAQGLPVHRPDAAVRGGGARRGRDDGDGVRRVGARPRRALGDGHGRQPEHGGGVHARGPRRHRARAHRRRDGEGGQGGRAGRGGEGEGGRR